MKEHELRKRIKREKIQEQMPESTRKRMDDLLDGLPEETKRSKIHRIWKNAVVFVAVLSLGFVSCSNNDGPDAPPTAETSIVGTWKATIANEGVDPQVVYFRFIKEGTLIGAYKDGSDPIEVSKGTWKIEKDRLLMRYKAEGRDEEENLNAKIVELKKDLLTVSFYDEEEKRETVMKFNRVTDADMDAFIAKDKKN